MDERMGEKYLKRGRGGAHVNAGPRHVRFKDEPWSF